MGNVLYLFLSSRRYPWSDKRLLRGLLALLTIPVIFQTSGLDSLLGLRLRSIMISLGWYDHRHVAQLLSMLMIGLSASGLAFQRVRALSPLLRRRLAAAFWGGAGFLTISIFQSISYHDMDALFSQAISSWQYHYIAKAFFLVLISAASLADGFDLLQTRTFRRLRTPD
jgi:hypothetical protein